MAGTSLYFAAPNPETNDAHVAPDASFYETPLESGGLEKPCVSPHSTSKHRFPRARY